ncbi:MAG: ECF transporter S component [Lachnospiraceae bacterium]|nr:ECF transporter S component [Lachnospiraceae bacterium]
MNKKISKIITLAVFITLVVVFSYIRIRFGEGSVHLGNGMCLLSGLVLTPFLGGVAAGVGSMIFDIFAYPTAFSFEFLITFFTKFMMAFVCGMVFRAIKKLFSKVYKANIDVISIILSGIAGEIAYIVLYLTKSYFENIYIIGISKDIIFPLLIGKLIASLINAVFAVVMASVLYSVIMRIIKKENL